MTETYRSRLELLIMEGRQLQAAASADPNGPLNLERLRLWQRECGTVVNELSGGTKAHWLAQAFSNAFLVRTVDGPVVTSAPPAEIVGRIVDVLARATASLAHAEQTAGTTSSSGPPPRRFDFVHDTTLRPILETAYLESKQAFEKGRYDAALMTTCGLLEAVITDALRHARGTELDGSSEKPLIEWSFSERIAAAEAAGLIRGGCARLPALGLQYRGLLNADGGLRRDIEVAERDARLAAQVLNVILRDLNPGR